MPGTTLANQISDYWVDSLQRTILYADTMRQRGENFISHSKAGKPPVLIFEHEVVLDAHNFEPAANYALLKIIPPAEHPTNPAARPFMIIDPRAGHGPGIAGSKVHSSIGVALEAGHPCYFVTFGPLPCPGQTIEGVLRAEIQFLKKVNELHADCSEKPFVIGNCQGGWALMLLACTSPELVGPIMLAGAPLSYWSGKSGQNPMRYSGGLLGGSWLSSLVSDMGNGHFDGAYLVQNFESLNPANTLWGKQYQLYSNVDTEAQRYLDFERWWGGHFLMNRAEIDWIVQNLFIGNKLSRGGIPDPINGGVIDPRNIRTPIIVFASHGDNITPPPQALNWICDLYADVEDIRVRKQVIVYCLHEKIGHLGIFVSGGIADREHSKLVGALELIELLPPGLYEATIEDLDAGTPHQELISGKHLIRFEPRTLDDIRALDDEREDEAQFEVVKVLAERNQQVYDQFLSPIVRAMSNDSTAKINRLLHPCRIDHYMWSGLNPLTWGLSAIANAVRQQRKPVEQDNPCLQIEQAASAQLMQHLDKWRVDRDTGAESLFKSLYQAPWLRPLLGLNEKPQVTIPVNHNPALLEEAREFAINTVAQGGIQEALIRSLIYLHGTSAFIDERAFHLCENIIASQTVFPAPTPEQLHQTMRNQALILRENAYGALQTLPELVPDQAGRHWIWSVVTAVMALEDASNIEPDVEFRHEKLSGLIGPLSETPLEAIPKELQEEMQEIRETQIEAPVEVQAKDLQKESPAPQQIKQQGTQKQTPANTPGARRNKPASSRTSARNAVSQARSLKKTA